MNIWLKSFGIMCIGTVAFVVAIFVLVAIEDFMVKRFGKPPTILVIINGVIWFIAILIAVKRSIE